MVGKNWIPYALIGIRAGQERLCEFVLDHLLSCCLARRGSLILSLMGRIVSPSELYPGNLTGKSNIAGTRCLLGEPPNVLRFLFTYLGDHSP